jgi:hypothetical protein
LYTNNKINKKVLSILFICIIITPFLNNTDIVFSENISKKNINLNNELTEYWAIIFAVGIYNNHPNQNRPSMIEAADDFYETLLNYPIWDEDHVHIVKGTQATGQNLIRELIWLIQHEDNDDMSLIYITTHGSPLKDQNGNYVDIPPIDESDGADEILLMYDGFNKWYSFIWDDLLNFFLGMLQSKGICLIIDSCYSGGFNDNSLNNEISNEFNESFNIAFGYELLKQNRIILMSSEEDTVSYGSYFSFHLINGFDGVADIYGNNDGINSAEESFYYAQNKIDSIGLQHPTILDNFQGEFPITY